MPACSLPLGDILSRAARAAREGRRQCRAGDPLGQSEDLSFCRDWVTCLQQVCPCPAALCGDDIRQGRVDWDGRVRGSEGCFRERGVLPEAPRSWKRKESPEKGLKVFLGINNSSRTTSY